MDSMNTPKTNPKNRTGQLARSLHGQTSRVIIKFGYKKINTITRFTNNKTRRHRHEHTRHTEEWSGCGNTTHRTLSSKAQELSICVIPPSHLYLGRVNKMLHLFISSLACSCRMRLSKKREQIHLVQAHYGELTKEGKQMRESSILAL